MLRLLFPLRVRQWLGPIAVVGLVAAAIALLVIGTGWLDLSARKPHPQGWAKVLHFTFRRSTAFHRNRAAPPADLDSSIRVAAGARYYGQVCAHCHSGPGLGQNPVVLMMHPRPQYLATDLAQPRSRLFARRAVPHRGGGVKYSAMPGWPASGRPDEVWQMVAFLRALPRLTPDQFRALALSQPAPAAAVAGSDRRFGPPPHQRRYAMVNDAEPPLASYNYRWPVLPFGSGEALTGDPVANCGTCHGADGRGGGAFPNLTIQDPSYLRRTLAAFADGTRASGFMRVMASQLSPRQVDALANYYGALPRKATGPAGPADPLGQQLALVGNRANGLGPCAGCHGVNLAAAKAYPVLEGQSAWYVANQMRVFRSGGRGGVEGRNPMPAIAARMNDRQIEAVARYYAAQPPAERQSFAAVKAAG